MKPSLQFLLLFVCLYFVTSSSAFTPLSRHQHLRRLLLHTSPTSGHIKLPHPLILRGCWGAQAVVHCMHAVSFPKGVIHHNGCHHLGYFSCAQQFISNLHKLFLSLAVNTFVMQIIRVPFLHYASNGVLCFAFCLDLIAFVCFLHRFTGLSYFPLSIFNQYLGHSFRT